MKGLIFLQNIEEQLQALYSEDMATIEARIKTKTKHRKSRKGQFKSKEKKCLRGEGKNLINSQCIFKYYVRNYRICGDFWGIFYYSDNTPAYFMVDCRDRSLYFYDEMMRMMFGFSFACDLYDFFIPDKEVYPWEPYYQEAYKNYTGEYFEETRDRVYPPRSYITHREIVGYKNENKYRRYKNLQSSSKWFKKLEKPKKIRTKEKQVFDKLKKIEDIEGYDYIFPIQAEAEYVY